MHKRASKTSCPSLGLGLRAPVGHDFAQARLLSQREASVAESITRLRTATASEMSAASSSIRWRGESVHRVMPPSAYAFCSGVPTAPPMRSSASMWSRRSWKARSDSLRFMRYAPEAMSSAWSFKLRSASRRSLPDASPSVCMSVGAACASGTSSVNATVRSVTSSACSIAQEKRSSP